jgi:hypothetical protein
MAVDKRELPITYLRPARGWIALNLSALWAYRELVYFLTWRDIKVRYKQAALGVAWAVIQPVVNMVIFTVIFGRLAGLETDAGIRRPGTRFLPLPRCCPGSFSRERCSVRGSAWSECQFADQGLFPASDYSLFGCRRRDGRFCDLIPGAGRPDALLPGAVYLEPACGCPRWFCWR